MIYTYIHFINIQRRMKIMHMTVDRVMLYICIAHIYDILYRETPKRPRIFELNIKMITTNKVKKCELYLNQHT